MEPLRRVSSREAESLIELSIYDDKVCTKAIAYTLTPDEAQPPGLFGTLWEKVTYYADSESINNTSLSPLEFMYKEWDMNKDIDNEKE